MDVSRQNLDYFTEDSTAWFSGLNQCKTGEDCSWVLDGILDIRAQDGTFALCRLSIKHNVLLFFFNHVQKASQV